MATNLSIAEIPKILDTQIEKYLNEKFKQLKEEKLLEIAEQIEKQKPAIVGHIIMHFKKDYAGNNIIIQI